MQHPGSMELGLSDQLKIDTSISCPIVSCNTSNDWLPKSVDKLMAMTSVVLEQKLQS
jgi:hypothetical protein